MTIAETDLLSSFSHQLRAASSFNEALDLLYDIVQQCGFRGLVYARGQMVFPDNPLEYPPDVQVRGFPMAWEGNYQRLGRHDPYFRLPCSLMRDLLWSDIHARRSDFPRSVTQFIDWSLDLGFREGISIPVRMSQHRYAIISAIDTVDRKDLRRASAIRHILLIAANYFNNVVTEQFAEASAQFPQLSKREQECMFWYGQGKSIEDIAVILNLSQETIRTYFKRVTAKMNAANRTNALVKAMDLGLLHDEGRLFGSCAPWHLNS